MKAIIDNLNILLGKTPVDPLKFDVFIKKNIALSCKVQPEDIISFRILQKSIDARNKRSIKLLYKVMADFRNHVPPKAKAYDEALENACIYDNFKASPGKPLNPLIIGTGPAGLMAAYLLAEYGCKPIILDRGFDVDTRHKDIDKFYAERQLNTESNFLFGEGGAGTYSDGKLYTRIRDERIKFIINLFIAAGASPEISYLKHPHIGSDILPGMVKNIRKRIEEKGGRFLWGRNVTDVIIKNGFCNGVIVNKSERVEAPATVIAAGASARDLIRNMIANGIEHKVKDFQLGSRIEHEQHFINRAQYGTSQLHPALGAAEYSVTSRPSPNRNIANVTSFCMCPGGEIIPATSDHAQLSTNGMSCFARSGKFANSALIVNQHAENFSSAAEAFDFIASLEKKIYAAGGGDFSCPAQDAGAFVNGSKKLSLSETSYKFGLKAERLDSIFPALISNALKEALVYFEKVMPGFMTTGKLVGAETRVSSPVRFIRNEDTLRSSAENLYIAGEGAGYAGGIMSAAVDGLKIGEAILKGLK